MQPIQTKVYTNTGHFHKYCVCVSVCVYNLFDVGYNWGWWAQGLIIAVVPNYVVNSKLYCVNSKLYPATRTVDLYLVNQMES